MTGQFDPYQAQERDDDICPEGTTYSSPGLQSWVKVHFMLWSQRDYLCSGRRYSLRDQRSPILTDPGL